MKSRKIVFKIKSRKSQITSIRRSLPSTGVKALVAFVVVVAVAVVGQVVVAGFVAAVAAVVDVAATLGSESRTKSQSIIFLVVFKV